MLLNSRMFKTLISCVLVLSLALSVMVPAFAAPTKAASLTFREETAQEALNDWMDAFLMEQPINGQEPGLTSRRWTNGNGRTDFWISAIVFDSFSDVLEYGTDEEYKAEIEEVMYQLYRGFYYAAQQQWGSTYETNTYNDDVCWWAMVMERAYELTGKEEYFDLAKACIDRVILDWDETEAFGGEPYGGILWRWSKALSIENNSKDTCANGNTSLTCARMARVCEEKGMTEDAAKYLDMAKKIYDWSEAHLIDDNGYVWNDVNYQGTRRNWQFTYCYGVSAGAAYELYKCTGEQEYLDRAITIMQYGFNTRTQADGLTMVKEGDRGAGVNDDADAFKNIMLRIAAQMVHEGVAPQFEKYINHNAMQAYKNRRFSDGLINRNLAVAPTATEPCNSPCAIMAPSLLYWATLDNEEDYPERIDPSLPVDGRYEAEAAESADVAFQGDETASGGQTVQYWDADNAHVATGYVKFNVKAEVAGEYNINLVWKSRNQTGTRHIQVNDGPDEKFTFPAGNNGQFVTTAIPATLNKGENTIKVSYWNNDLHAGEKDTQSWWFLDYLEIELVKADEAAAEEMLDAWLDTFLAERTTKDGGVKGLTSWRWSDKWQERQMDVESGEPRETDFWLSGIVFESFNDVLEYGHNDEYKAKIEEIMYGLYEGFAKSENHPNWDVDTWQENTYNDDLCWWSLALLRAYQLTGEQEYFDLSKQLVDKLLTDYDESEGFGGEPYGGILWRRSEAVPVGNNKASKDSCANGNAGMITYRFAQEYKKMAKAEKDPELKAEYQALEQHYAEFGDKIYTWAMAHLYRDSDAYVTNSINENGSRNEAQFTYNYGVIAGAAYERYLYTGDKQYLERATRIMDSAFKRFTQNDGYTIKSEGTGDSAGFKTIMLRVAADMYNDGNAPQYKDYLEVNAVRAYRNRRDSDGLVGDNIRQTPADNVRLCSPCAILGPSLLYWAGFSANTESADSWAWSGSEDANKYEAEWARLYHINVAANQYDGNSGYDDIWYWDNGGKDGFIEFLVEAPKAGGYMLNFHYLQRAASERLLTVNGNEIGTVSFLGGAQWDDATAIVTLAEGKNTVRLSFTGGETWNYLDYLYVTSATATVDKANVKVNEEFVIKVVTESNVTRVGLVNENGKYLGKKAVEAVENEDGTITWSITTAMTTKGDRTIGVVVDSGNGELKEQPIATVEVSVSDAVADTAVGATINEAVKLPETAKKNEAFTITVVTSTGVSNVGIFNENDKAIGKISQNCVDNEEGERTWTITIKVGSRGVRNFTVKAADAAGNWVAEQAAAITIK